MKLTTGAVPFTKLNTKLNAGGGAFRGISVDLAIDQSHKHIHIHLSLRRRFYKIQEPGNRWVRILRALLAQQTRLDRPDAERGIRTCMLPLLRAKLIKGRNWPWDDVLDAEQLRRCTSFWQHNHLCMHTCQAEYLRNLMRVPFSDTAQE